jgi:hypothetical protein
MVNRKLDPNSDKKKKEQQSFFRKEEVLGRLAPDSLFSAHQLARVCRHAMTSPAKPLNLSCAV